MAVSPFAPFFPSGLGDTMKGTGYKMRSSWFLTQWTPAGCSVASAVSVQSNGGLCPALSCLAGHTLLPGWLDLKVDKQTKPKLDSLSIIRMSGGLIQYSFLLGLGMPCVV